MEENNEQKESKERIAKANAQEDSNHGNQPQAVDIIGRAEQAAQRLEAQQKAAQAENERAERNLRELREIEARKLLGGETLAGQNTQKKEESNKEFMQRVLRQGHF